MAEIQLPDGNIAKIPDFALESTQSKMHDLIRAMVDSNKKSKAALDQINKNAVAAQDKDKKVAEAALAEQQRQTKLLQDQLKDNQSFRSTFSSRVESDLTSMFTGTGNLLTGLAKGALVATAAVGGILVGAITKTVSAFMDVGNSLRSLTEVGMAGPGLLPDVAKLAEFGMTVDQAAQTLSRFSASAAVLGRANFSDFVSGMARTAEMSTELGLLYSESVELIGEEIELRRQSSVQQMRLNGLDQVAMAERIKQTRAFSQATGKSISEMMSASKNFFDNNTRVAGALLSLSGEASERTRAEMDMSVRAASAIGTGFQSLLASTLSAASEVIPQASQEFLDVMKTAGLQDLGTTLTQISNRMRTGGLSEGEGLKLVRDLATELSLVKDESLILLRRQSEQMGNQTAAAAIQAMSEIQLLGDKLDKMLTEQQLNQPVDDFLQTVTGIQNALNRFKGIFTGIVLKAFEALTPVLNAFTVDSKIFDTLSTAVKTVFDAVMRLFGSTLSSASSEASTVTYNLKLFGGWITKTSKSIADFLDSIDPDNKMTFMEKLNAILIKLFDLIKPAVISGLTDVATGVIKSLFSNPEVINAMVLGITALFTASVVKSALAAGMSSLLKWVTTGGTAAAAAGTAATTAAAGTSLLGKTQNFVRGVPGMGIAGRAVTAGSGILSGVMVGKDALDVGVAAATGSDIKGEDVGGVIGGILGGVGGAFLGGPVGAAIGASLGNMAGNWIGSFFDDDEAEAASVEVAEKAKEELIQQQGLAAMAIDPDHVAKVTGALRVFSKLDLTPVINMFVGAHVAIRDFVSVIERVRTNAGQSMQLFLNNAKNFETAGITVLANALSGFNNVAGLFLSMAEMFPAAGAKINDTLSLLSKIPADPLIKLGNALSVLAKGIGDLAESTTQNLFESIFNSDNTTEFVNNLNQLASIDSDRLLKSAQAIIVMNAAKSGATQAAIVQPAAQSAANTVSPIGGMADVALTQMINNTNNTLTQLNTEIANMNRELKRIRGNTGDTAKNTA